MHAPHLAQSPSRRALVWLFAGIAAGCFPDPDNDLEEFQERHSRIDAGVATACAPLGRQVEAGEIDGSYFLALTTSPSPDLPLTFLASVTTSLEGQGVQMSWDLQPLVIIDRRTSAGPPLSIEGIAVEPDGGFEVRFDMPLVGAANPTGTDSRAEVELVGSICQGGEFFCGTMNGQVVEPLVLSLANSTFTLSRVTTPETYPDPPPADCSGEAGGPAPCPHEGPPVIDPASLPSCDSCDGARCVTTDGVPPHIRDRLADCDATSKCVPDEFLRNGGGLLLPTCRSINDGEGRCLSTCIPLVGSQADLLPRDVCAANERCVPCFSPTDGSETGVCDIGCGPGPQEPPAVFDACCEGEAACVPADIVPERFRSYLGPESCTSSGVLCVPHELTNPESRLTTCDSMIEAEGRCVSRCVALVSEQEDQLPQDVCPDSHRCVPCYDPRNGEDTGICRVNGDEPTRPAKVFAPCCSGDGKCVPEELVPPEAAANLPQDSCAEGEVCAPEEVVDDPEYSFPACTTDLPVPGQPGACYGECFVTGANAALSSQGSCPEGDRCVPCDDPSTGEPTGACT